MTTKKVSTKSNKKQVHSKSASALISKEEVYNVLEFATAVYSGLYPNVYTPDLVSSRLKDITLTPQIATLEKINTALSSPKDNEEQLIGYSQWLELNSMLMKRLMLYFSGMMSFDWNYVVTNIKDEKEYSSPAYKKDIQIVADFFDKLDVKDAFKTAMRQMLRNETYYGVLREDEQKYVLQELPRQRCKITGRFDYGLVYDFDMNWFIQPAVSLDMYPSVFKKMFKRAFMKSGSEDYNPALDINMRDTNWVYWVQTSPADGFVAFKLFPEIATNIPFLAPFMPDAIMQPVIRALQLDNYIADASKLIAGQVPFLKESKANVKDAIALDPTTLGKFLGLMKSALPAVIKVISAPLENISPIEFKGNTELYDSYLSTAASSSGVNSRLIYSKDRQNVLETKISVEIDTNVLKPVYTQFSNMLEYWVNQRTKKYKFRFMFEGFETAIDRETRFERVSKLAEQGIVLHQKYASALGVSPFDLVRMMQETRAMGFVDKLTPIIKSSQMPSDATGRPKKEDSSLSEGGADTRGDGEDATA